VLDAAGAGHRGRAYRANPRVVRRYSSFASVDLVTASPTINFVGACAYWRKMALRVNWVSLYKVRALIRLTGRHGTCAKVKSITE